MYVAAVSAVLSDYPPEVIDYVCDPRTGLPRTLKYLPTIAEIVDACDSRMKLAEALEKLRQRAERERATLANPNATDLDKRRAQDWLEKCAPKEGK
jgi:hypothetical protein